MTDATPQRFTDPEHIERAKVGRYEDEDVEEITALGDHA